jgi:hypothetical protein
MLYPFELGLLDERESHELEIHLYECEHCFKRVQNFKAAASLLVHDDDVHGELKAATEQDSESADELSYGRKQRLLPRYLMAAVLVLAVGIPLYRSSTPVHIQSIYLTPMRGTETEVLSIDQGGAVEIHMAIELLKAGGVFSLTLHAVDGDTVYSDQEFGDFDSAGSSTLELPVDSFDPGYHMLTISDPSGTYLETPVHYLFRVE